MESNWLMRHDSRSQRLCLSRPNAAMSTNVPLQDTATSLLSTILPGKRGEAYRGIFSVSSQRRSDSQVDQWLRTTFLKILQFGTALQNFLNQLAVRRFG